MKVFSINSIFAALLACVSFAATAQFKVTHGLQDYSPLAGTTVATNDLDIVPNRGYVTAGDFAPTTVTCATGAGLANPGTRRIHLTGYSGGFGATPTNYTPFFHNTYLTNAEYTGCALNGFNYDVTDVKYDALDNTYIVSGVKGGAVAGTTVASATRAAFLMKTDFAGNVLWFNIYSVSTTSNDRLFFNSVTPTSTGDYVAAGYRLMAGTGRKLATVIKVNNLGNTIWRREVVGQTITVCSSPLIRIISSTEYEDVIEFQPGCYALTGTGNIFNYTSPVTACPFTRNTSDVMISVADALGGLQTYEYVQGGNNNYESGKSIVYDPTTASFTVVGTTKQAAANGNNPYLAMNVRANCLGSPWGMVNWYNLNYVFASNGTVNADALDVILPAANPGTYAITGTLRGTPSSAAALNEALLATGSIATGASISHESMLINNQLSGEELVENRFNPGTTGSSNNNFVFTGNTGGNTTTATAGASIADLFVRENIVPTAVSCQSVALQVQGANLAIGIQQRGRAAVNTLLINDPHKAVQSPVITTKPCGDPEGTTVTTVCTPPTVSISRNGPWAAINYAGGSAGVQLRVTYTPISPCVGVATTVLVTGASPFVLSSTLNTNCLYNWVIEYQCPGTAAWQPLTTITARMASNEPIANAFKLNLYPNPTSAIANINFSLSEAANVDMTITNIAGQIVAQPLVNTQHREGSHTFEYNTTDLAAGVYFCTIRTGSITQTQKLIIQR